MVGQNWGELIKVLNGGPGELPGRDQAISNSKKRSELRYKIKTHKKNRLARSLLACHDSQAITFKP